MKSTSLFLGLFLCLLGPLLRAADVTITAAKVQDGVYFSYTGYTTTVLEVKNGHFRYWWESTETNMPKYPVYPITGVYSISGETVTLKGAKVQVFQPTWTFRSFDGIVSLWRPDALSHFEIGKYLDLVKKFGCDSILVKTDRTADDVWKHRGAPSL